MALLHPNLSPDPTQKGGFAFPLLPRQTEKRAKKEAGTLGGLHSPELPQPISETKPSLWTPEEPQQGQVKGGAGLSWEREAGSSFVPTYRYISCQLPRHTLEGHKLGYLMPL